MNDNIKQEDEIYCPECGKPIRRTAVFCEHCGTKLKDTKEYQSEPIRQKEYSPKPKNKAVAIILAVIFGYWSWLYTYKKDTTKFWVYLCILLPSSVGMVILLNIFISNQTTGKFFTNYGTWIWLYFLISSSASIWALVKSIGRPASFYDNYPD
jgi:glucose uptake protein GlcU